MLVIFNLFIETLSSRLVLLQQPAKKARYCMATNDNPEARTLATFVVLSFHVVLIASPDLYYD